ncbi:MAG: hypothetical protein E7406_03395 [Ruminococcaceae bacterium]|nr:hypothetical protein [Oscillospiraceae bacterium]
MKNFKKIATLVIAVILAVATFAGCGGGAGSGKKIEPAVDISGMEAITENTMPISEDGIKISIYLDNKSRDAVADYNESPAMQELQKRTGITIDFQHPVDTTTDKVSLMINSGQIPDVLFISTYFYGGWNKAAVKEAAYNGMFLKLDDYIDKFAPHIKAFLEKHPDAEKTIRMYNDDGGIYGIPTCYTDRAYNYYDGYFIRKDWLDKVDIEERLKNPENIRTIEDWETVLTAFVEQDPNGNGKKDEVGFSTFAYMTKFVFMPAFDVFNWNYYLDPDDNEITHGVVEDGMRDFIAMICDWRERGLVNPDYATTDQKTLDYLVLNDQLGAFYCDYNNTAIKYVLAAKEKKSSMNLVPVPMVENSKGQARTGKVGKGVVGGTSALINSQSKYAVEIVRLFDYLYSPEGNALGNWGIEGETYTVDANGKKHFTEKITGADNIIDAYNAYTAAGVNGGIVCLYDNEVNKALNSSITAEQKKLQDKATEYCIAVDKCANLPASPTTLKEDDKITDLSKDLTTYLTENWALFLSGEKTLEDYDKFVKEVKKMGMEEILKIKQAAYKRGLEKTEYLDEKIAAMEAAEAAE